MGRGNFSLTSPLAKGEGHFSHFWKKTIQNCPQYPTQGVKIYGAPAHSVAAQGTVGGLATGVLTKVWWHKTPWTVFLLVAATLV